MPSTVTCRYFLYFLFLVYARNVACDVIWSDVCSFFTVESLYQIFGLDPCFCHAKLTATVWVSAACKWWDGRGVSASVKEWKAAMRATPMVLHNWLHPVFFKGSFSLCRSLTASLLLLQLTVQQWVYVAQKLPHNWVTVSLNLSVLPIKEWSTAYVYVLIHPGCC